MEKIVKNIFFNNVIFFLIKEKITPSKWFTVECMSEADIQFKNVYILSRRLLIDLSIM